MLTAFAQRPRARIIIALIIGAGALSYFGYHAINGKRGLIAWVQIYWMNEHVTFWVSRIQMKSSFCVASPTLGGAPTSGCGLDTPPLINNMLRPAFHTGKACSAVPGFAV
jgi:hypothetical protein